MVRGRAFPGSRQGRQNRGPQRSGRCRRRETAQNQGHNRKSKGRKQHIHDFSPYHWRQTCREKRAACGSSRGPPTASQQQHAAWSSRRVTAGSLLARPSPPPDRGRTAPPQAGPPRLVPCTFRAVIAPYPDHGPPRSRLVSWPATDPLAGATRQPNTHTTRQPGRPPSTQPHVQRPDSARRPPRSRPNQAGGRTRGGTPLVLSPIKTPQRRETGRIPCRQSANRPHRRTAGEQSNASSSRHDALRRTAEAPAQIRIVAASASGAALGVVAGHVFAPVVAPGSAPANRRVESVPARVCAPVRDGSLRHCASPPHTAGPDGPTVRAGCHWGRRCGRPARLVPRTLRAPAYYTLRPARMPAAFQAQRSGRFSQPRGRQSRAATARQPPLRPALPRQAERLPFFIFLRRLSTSLVPRSSDRTPQPYN